MNQRKIAFKETGRFSNRINNYTEGLNSLAPFYSYEPSIDGLLLASKNRKFEDSDRYILSEVIKNQFDGIEMTESQSRNIELLKLSNTYTITTGHQLCLLTGPLYTIYKIATVINTANQLNETQKEFRYVPVFWMATEDHDFEEINHINLFGKKITWEKDSLKQPVGDIKIENMDEFWNSIELIIPDSITVKRWRNYADKSQNLAAFTRLVINDLFAVFGLLILDPTDIRLKKQFINYAINEFESNFSDIEVKAQTLKLLNLGYKEQAFSREINLFLVIDGVRNRVKQNFDGFKVGDVVYTKQELTDYIFRNPKSISPNVILRPLYQEVILPNVAYVGGGGEIAYWFQLKSLFEKSKVDFPVLLVRNSFMLYEGSLIKKLSKLGLSITDLFLPIKEIENRILFDSSNKVDFEKYKSALNSIFVELGNELKTTDKQLETATDIEYSKAVKQIETLKKKYIKATIDKEAIKLNQLNKMLESVFPGNELQERVENVLMYLDNKSDFIDTIVNTANPFEDQFVLIEL